MFLYKLFEFILLYAPVDTPVSAPPADLSGRDIFNLLGDDEEKPEVIDLKPPKEDKKDEVKEDKEDKEETEEEKIAREAKEKEEKDKELELDEEETLDEIPPENLELITPVRRKEILAAYPDLFKKFPYLNNAYYREQAYTEIFPDPEDAKIALEKAEALDNFENDLQKGSIQKVLETIKKDNVNSFYTLVDGLLMQLAEVDEKAHTHIIGNVINTAVKSMALEAKRTNNDDLKKAALLLNQFVFGRSEYEEQKPLGKEIKPEDKSKDDELEKERKAIVRERFEDAQQRINTRVDKVLKATVEENIDPKNTMTPFIKKYATKEVIDTVVKQIAEDSRFTKIMDKLWDNALKEKFSETSQAKIKDAYLSKAKVLLPGAIAKSRSEALKGMGKKSKDVDVDESQDETTDNAEENNRTSPPRNRTRQPRESEKPKGKPEGMSTRDFLMKD